MTRTAHWGSSKDDQTIDKPKWTIIKIDPNGIQVTWKEKYGPEVTDNCIGLWENETEYLLTWKDSKKRILQKSNVTSIEAKILDKK